MSLHNYSHLNEDSGMYADSPISDGDLSEEDKDLDPEAEEDDSEEDKEDELDAEEEDEDLE